MSASGYEIVGTEQIMQAILDNKDYKIVDVLNGYSIDSESFSKKVSEVPSRSAEFENSEKQIIFTPNAFYASDRQYPWNRADKCSGDHFIKLYSSREKDF